MKLSPGPGYWMSGLYCGLSLLGIAKGHTGYALFCLAMSALCLYAAVNRLP